MSRGVMFADRGEAGRLLADRLAAMSLGHALVLALPRGGVAVGAEIARRLATPLALAHVRKIGAPDQPELAVGAVADGEHPEIVVNGALLRRLALSEEFVLREAERACAELARRRSAYAEADAPADLTGRVAIIVDDGVATGMTMRAALRQVRRRGPSRLIAAAPVAAREGLAMLAADADDVVCVASPRRFGAVAAFYLSFPQLTDADVARLLRESARP
jgi:putative phosphoribosyl transferase